MFEDKFNKLISDSERIDLLDIPSKSIEIVDDIDRFNITPGQSYYYEKDKILLKKLKDHWIGINIKTEDKKEYPKSINEDLERLQKTVINLKSYIDMEIEKVNNLVSKEIKNLNSRLKKIEDVQEGNEEF